MGCQQPTSDRATARRGGERSGALALLSGHHVGHGTPRGGWLAEEESNLRHRPYQERVLTTELPTIVFGVRNGANTCALGRTRTSDPHVRNVVRYPSTPRGLGADGGTRTHTLSIRSRAHDPTALHRHELVGAGARSRTEPVPLTRRPLPHGCITGMNFLEPMVGIEPTASRVPGGRIHLGCFIGVTCLAPAPGIEPGSVSGNSRVRSP